MDPTVIKIKAVGDGSTSWIIIMVSIVLLTLVLVLLCFRYFYYQSKKEILDAERRIQKKNEFAMELEKDENMKKDDKSRYSQVSAAQLVSGKKVNYDSVKDSSVESHQVVSMIPEYADQYDPNQDFAIFQVGNKTTGGVMTMQEKMNVADNINESSEEEDDTIMAQSTSAAATKLSVSNQGEIM